MLFLDPGLSEIRIFGTRLNWRVNMAGGVKQGAFLGDIYFYGFLFLCAYKRRNRQITARLFIYTSYYVGMHLIMPV